MSRGNVPKIKRGDQFWHLKAEDEALRTSFQFHSSLFVYRFSGFKSLQSSFMENSSFYIIFSNRLCGDYVKLMSLWQKCTVKSCG